MSNPYEQVLRNVSHHPWAHLMDEKRDGAWAHYAAWERWMSANLENEGGDWAECDWWEEDEGEIMERIDLFGEHCDQADAMRTDKEH